MIAIGAAGTGDDKRHRLTEFSRSSRGEHLELRDCIQRWDLRLRSLQRDLGVADTVERGREAAVGVARTGARGKCKTPSSKLVLRANTLHAGGQRDQPHEAEAAIERGVLNGLALNDGANRGLTSLDDRRRTRDFNGFRDRTQRKYRREGNGLVDGEVNASLPKMLESLMLH